MKPSEHKCDTPSLNWDDGIWYCDMCGYCQNVTDEEARAINDAWHKKHDAAGP